MPRNWTEGELLIAINLYCRLPFGKFHKGNKEIIAVSKKINRTPSSLAIKLSNLASLDPHHKKRGVRGMSNVSNLDREIWGRFHENWQEMVSKSEAAYEKIMGPAIEEPEVPSTFQLSDGPSEMNRLVKTRRIQQFFRRSVLASYQNNCAIAGHLPSQLLVASHIIPWSEDESRRGDPTNGICLNSLHDKAFDRNLITFDEKLRLVVSGQLKQKNASPFQSVNFEQLEGKPLIMPHRFHPDPVAMEAHRNKFID